MNISIKMINIRFVKIKTDKIKYNFLQKISNLKRKINKIILICSKINK